MNSLNTHYVLNMGNRSNEVQGRVEEDPGHVNIVPVNGAGFDTPMPLSRIMASTAVIPNNDNKDYTAHHVKGVNAGHAEENRAINPVGRA